MFLYDISISFSALRNGFNDSSTKETTTEYQNRPDNGNSSKQGITNEDRNADENEQITEHNIIPEASHQNDRLQEDTRILNNDKVSGSNENSAEKVIGGLKMTMVVLNILQRQN